MTKPREAKPFTRNRLRLYTMTWLRSSIRLITSENNLRVPGSARSDEEDPALQNLKELLE
jgi:hypothetical protein